MSMFTLRRAFSLSATGAFGGLGGLPGLGRGAPGALRGGDLGLRGWFSR